MSIKFSPVIWDVDGTILNSGPEIFNRISLILERLHQPQLPQTTLRKFIGPPLNESFMKFAGMDESMANEAVQHARNIAAAQSPEYLIEPYPGVLETIRELHKLQIPQAVASAKGHNLVVKSVEHFGVADCFVTMRGADIDNGIIHKDKIIGLALQDMKKSQVSTENAVMIGDRIHDLEGASKFGIPTIIVEWGYGDGEPIPAAYASVKTITELRAELGFC